MTSRLTPNNEVDICNAFTIDLVSMADLALTYGRTRQGIWKTLKRNGVEPSEYGRITTSCSACGEPVTRPRSQIRARKHVFCSMDCYYLFIEGKQEGEYNQNRHGQRIGRAIISNYYTILHGQVVHHEDRNCQHNHPSNLKVFANQGDHIRYHRWGKDGVVVKPVWDGSSV